MHIQSKTKIFVQILSNFSDRIVSPRSGNNHTAIVLVYEPFSFTLNICVKNIKCIDDRCRVFDKIKYISRSIKSETIYFFNKLMIS